MHLLPMILQGLQLTSVVSLKQGSKDMEDDKEGFKVETSFFLKPALEAAVLLAGLAFIICGFCSAVLGPEAWVAAA